MILIGLVFTVHAEEAKAPMVAVLPFASRILDTGAIEGLVSAMGSELMNTGRFRVMERSQMETILKEQGFANSGACDGSECAVEVGKLLSVDQVVLGTIAKVGNVYSMTARLVSVQTGEIRKSATRNTRGDEGAILTDILPQMAHALADQKRENPVATASDPASQPRPAAADSSRSARAKMAPYVADPPSQRGEPEQASKVRGVKRQIRLLVSGLVVVVGIALVVLGLTSGIK